MSNPFTDRLAPNSFEFKCLYCDEKFVIHLDELAKDSRIICPNCKHQLNDEAAANIQLSIQHLEKALQILYDTNIPPENELVPYLFSGDGFKFRIKWHESNFLPEKRLIDC